MSEGIEIQHLKGSDPALARYLRDLARLRIEVFRDFPYLYDGTLEYEQNYLQTYAKCRDSIVILALDEGRVVGASTGLPLENETEEFKAPFIAKGLAPERIFYCGESVLLKSHRGRGIYSHFFNGREGHARELGRFDTICFCCVQRSENHPLRPGDYQPLDAIWGRFGYEKHPELFAEYVWKDLDEEQESAKEMVFWLKPLS